MWPRPIPQDKARAGWSFSKRHLSADAHVSKWQKVRIHGRDFAEGWQSSLKIGGISLERLKVTALGCPGGGARPSNSKYAYARQARPERTHAVHRAVCSHRMLKTSAGRALGPSEEGSAPLWGPGARGECL